MVTAVWRPTWLSRCITQTVQTCWGQRGVGSWSGRRAISSCSRPRDISSCSGRRAISSCSDPFDFGPYQCVGFDLDHTLCQYNLRTLLPMIYSRCLVPFLAGRWSDDVGACLGEWDADGRRLCARGLVLDGAHGNLLKLAADGRVLRALHGSRPLDSGQLARLYGADTALSSLTRSMRDPPGGRLRMLRDFFDSPVALAAARLVDACDAGRLPAGVDYPSIADGIRDALVHMYNRDHFSVQEGGFFHQLRSNTEQFAFACSPELVTGLQRLRSDGKLVFLVTSSNVDNASHMARLSLGADWRQCFDVVVTYARKPHFFSGRSPFLGLDAAGHETSAVPVDQLRTGEIYSQGNWQDLHAAFERLLGAPRPLCLYVGDNLAFDVHTTLNYTRAHAAAICEELESELGASCRAGMASALETSPVWGGMLSEGEEETVWGGLVRRATVCVPRTDYLFHGQR